MKMLASRLLAVSFLMYGSSSPGISSTYTTNPQAQGINRIGGSFRTAWQYYSPEDTFINAEVTGGQWWQASSMNVHDETKASVSNLTLSLESEHEFDIIKEQDLVTKGPPVYTWSFGDVQEGFGPDAWIGYGRDPHPFPMTFTPGFDASRTLDKTKFSEPGTQTLTITVTPREVEEGFGIRIQAFEDGQVDPIITSPSTGDGIELAPDRHSLNIHPTNLDLDVPWSITVTIDVSPKVPEATFMPYVLVSRETAIDSGIFDQGTFSHPVGDPSDEIGKWIWSADGDYWWDWQETLSRQVIWDYRQEGPPRVDLTCSGEGNCVRVSFINELHYEIPGNTFVNSEVIGDRWWRSNFCNDADETSEPIKDLRLSLAINQQFDGWESGYMTTEGPPSYEWSLGDAVEEPEREGWPWDAFVTITKFPTKFAPGLDVSRQFDQTEFSQPGTQTMTVTITPREEWVQSINLYIHTDETDWVAPSVVSFSSSTEGDIVITEGGNRSGMHSIPMEMDIPVTITALLHVEPKANPIMYQPYTAIDIKQIGQLSAGITQGDSVSYNNGAGVWTWSAQGDYEWMWQETLLGYGVVFPTRTELLSDSSVEGLAEERPIEDSSPKDENTASAFIAIVVGLAAAVASFVLWRLWKHKSNATP
jgi:hypothetical protein